MFILLSRFFKYFKEECLGLKRCEVDPYPFNRSMKDILPQAHSMSFAIRFAKDIGKDLDLSFLETEIILFLLTEKEGMSALDVAEFIDHVTPEHIARTLNDLCKKDYLYKAFGKNGIVTYSVLEKVKCDIGSYYKD